MQFTSLSFLVSPNFHQDEYIRVTLQSVGGDHLSFTAYKTTIGTYFCPQPHKELRSRICRKQSAPKQAESQVRKEVSQFIIEPDYLLAQATQKVAQLQRDYKQMQQEELHLQEEMNSLKDERQEFITKARKGRIPDAEFTSQMSALSEKERGV